MELIITLFGGAFVGYLVNKLERLEVKLNHLEDELIVIKIALPKRAVDFDNDSR